MVGLEHVTNRLKSQCSSNYAIHRIMNSVKSQSGSTNMK